MSITNSTLSEDAIREVFGKVVMENSPNEAFQKILRAFPDAAITINGENDFFLTSEGKQIGPSCSDVTEAIYYGLASISEG